MKTYGAAVLVFCAVIAGAFSLRPAGAMKPFFEQFKAIYVKPNTSDHTMRIFNAAVDKKGCNVCHHGKSKKNFNAYGLQVKKLLTKSDAGNPQKIQSAIKRVAGMKSNPSDPSSPTFAQRLKQGKLPVGEINVTPAKEAAN